MPALGESVTEATIGQWFKKEGEAVKADEPLVELETDKVTVEVPAPAAGVLQSIAVRARRDGNVGAVLGAIADGAAAAAVRRAAAGPQRLPPRPAVQPPVSPPSKPPVQPLSPAVRKIAEERRIDVSAADRHRQGRAPHQGRCFDSPAPPPRRRRRRPCRAADAEPGAAAARAHPAGRDGARGAGADDAGSAPPSPAVSRMPRTPPPC